MENKGYRRYCLRWGKKRQVSSNLKYLQLLKEEIENGLFKHKDKCDIFDFDTGEIIV